jgi:UDPglucose 6-dehydrogenase
MGILKAGDRTNDARVRAFVGKLKKALWILKDKRVGVLGLAFKPETDDVRESPALDIVPLLLEDGAEVTMYDPVAAPLDIEGAVRCETVWEALEGASAAVLVTEWQEFARLDWNAAAAAMARPLLIDGRNFIDPLAAADAGLEYEGIGLGDEVPAPVAR